MKTRTLKDGSVVNELAHAITMEVYTRCPEKYKLVDMQTGEEYIGNWTETPHMHWKKIKDGY